MRQKKGQLKARTGRSLNLILWLAFSFFAIVIILVFMAVQSLLVGQQYREETVRSMRSAGARTAEVLSEYAEGGTRSIWRAIVDIETEYGVNIRVLDADGSVLYNESQEGEYYREIVAELAQRLPEEGGIVLSHGNELVYATTVTLERQETGYLYITGSIARVYELESALWALSLVTALISVLMAFVLSGFVAMIITRPVTEVTERAKDLAHGHYDFNFRQEYFCSEIAELSDALESAREEISKADAMQKELIANVSHDFKTPLTMIKAYASMIREISGEDKAKRDAHAQIIIDEADRLASLVGDVLDISRLRAGVGAQAPAVFNLSDLVYKITDKFAYLTETEGYRLEICVEEELYAFADRERIEQVVYNLVGNAVNYTGEDKRVAVRLFRCDKGARLEIADTGMGIPPDELEKIWDRYYRLHETHKRPVKGTGLGLSIVKNILILQNCSFGVQSEVGKGSVFWVEFPSPPEDGYTDEETASANGHEEVRE